MELSNYKTWCFDCDGVLLDSNQLKSDSFYEVALPYGERNAQALVEYNNLHGGISRFEKFKYFLETILEKKTFEKELESALKKFSSLVCEKLISCSETSGVRSFLDSLPGDTKKYVVSGGAQAELQYVFQQRGLDAYFDGIFGSPDSKEVIMSSIIKSGVIEYPAVFVGDSRYDYEISSKFNIDFLFITQYSEFIEWELYFADKNIIIAENFSSIIGMIVGGD